MIKLKVAFCLGSLNKGGAERVVSNLANYLIQKNIDVFLIVTKLDKIEYDLNNKIQIYSLDNNNSKGFLSRNIKRIKNLKKYLSDLKIDLIFTFLQEPTARVMILKTFDYKIKKIPVIISVRIDPKYAFKTIKRKLGLILYDNANGFVFQTEEAKSFFNKKIQKKSIVIGNSLNPVFFNMNNYNYEKREKKIVSVGRLTKQKNYPMLIDAFSKVVKKYPEYILEIYGDGELKEFLTDYIERKKMKDKIFLKGNVSDIQNKIVNSMLFVITSDYEGMSNALMEAMSLGIPCISTNSSGGGAISIINNNENGIIVPIKDVEFLAKKMIYILSNKEIINSYSINAKESMKKFKPENINELWYNYMMEIYKKEKSNDE